MIVPANVPQYTMENPGEGYVYSVSDGTTGLIPNWLCVYDFCGGETFKYFALLRKSKIERVRGQHGPVFKADSTYAGSLGLIPIVGRKNIGSLPVLPKKIDIQMSL